MILFSVVFITNSIYSIFTTFILSRETLVMLLDLDGLPQ